jgi:essential nuclear protein 1
MPKAPKSPGARDQRHNPLAEEYAPSDPWKQKSAKRQKRNKDDKEDEEKFIDSKSSRKILDIGRELAEEDERQSQVRRPEAANPAFDFETRMGEDSVVIEEVEQFEDDDDEAWGEDDEVEEVEIDADDLAAWNKFIPTDDNPIVWPGEEAQSSGPGTDLAALILEKIAAHEASGGEVQPREILGGGDAEDAVELPAKVVEGIPHLFLQVIQLLNRYSILKDWAHNVPLQVRQASQTLQDSPHNPRMGNPPLHHTP